MKKNNKLKHILILSMILFLPSFLLAKYLSKKNEVYKLSDEIIIEEKFLQDKLIQYWCIDDYVWLEFARDNRGSMSQVLKNTNHGETHAVKCSEFK